MKKFGYIMIIGFVLIAASGCVPYSTGETEVGVRTVKFSFFGKTGVENKVYPPGSTYFFVPFMNDWHTFDTKLQNLEMTHQADKGDRRTRDDLLFKTIDGNDISLDVIIVYRLDPEKASYILQNVAIDDESLRGKIVRTIARSKPRDIFGELKTEEFYVADRREKQSQKAKEVLQEIFKPLGIIVEKVLTKDYRFNPEYQRAIEDKKVADQRVEKNKSAQRAAAEEYIRKLEEAKGEVNKIVANVNGEYEKSKISADAYYARQKMIAEAIKAEGIAESKGIEEMNKAMAGAGGEAMVKLKIAEALNGKRIILLPISQGGMNLNTLDMNQLINVIGIKSLSEQ